MSRIYLASSWRNPYQPNAVTMLRAAGHEVYDFRNPPNGVKGFAWSEIDPDWMGWKAAQYRDLLTTHAIASRGYLNDFRGMEWADTCVLLLPCGRSFLPSRSRCNRRCAKRFWRRGGSRPFRRLLFSLHRSSLVHKSGQRSFSRAPINSSWGHVEERACHCLPFA